MQLSGSQYLAQPLSILAYLQATFSLVNSVRFSEGCLSRKYIFFLRKEIAVIFVFFYLRLKIFLAKNFVGKKLLQIRRNYLAKRNFFTLEVFFFDTFSFTFKEKTLPLQRFNGRNEYLYRNDQISTRLFRRTKRGGIATSILTQEGNCLALPFICLWKSSLTNSPPESGGVRGGLNRR